MNHAQRVTRLLWSSLLWSGLLLSGLLSACGGNAPDASVGSPTAESATTHSRDFGDYVLHFNALRTDQLTADVARNYNIVRSPNRVLLNVSIIHKVEGTPGVPAAATVTASAVNSNGQLKDLGIRELREGDAIYYIGDVPIADNEALTFTIDAVPANETRHLSVKFQRDFS